MIHPADAAGLGIADGAEVVLGNRRGEVRIHARHFDGVCRGVLIAELIWPNDAYPDGRGINTLTGADAIAPYGGAAFHDNRVWIRPRVTNASVMRRVAACNHGGCFVIARTQFASTFAFCRTFASFRCRMSRR